MPGHVFQNTDFLDLIQGIGGGKALEQPADVVLYRGGDGVQYFYQTSHDKPVSFLAFWIFKLFKMLFDQLLAPELQSGMGKVERLVFGIF